jgi:AcrR family transcriptional regulator
MATRRTRAGERGYHHGDLKNALQRTAAELIRQRGAEAVSMREISLAAGVSHGAAYRHYPDKQALLADLAETGFRELAAIHVQTVQSTGGGPVEQLKACGCAYVEFGVRQPHLLQLMFGGVITNWDAHPSLSRAGAALAKALADVVQAGQHAKVLRAGDPQDLTLTAWSLVHGLAMLIVGRRIPGVTVDDAFARSAARRSVELLVDGLRG